MASAELLYAINRYMKKYYVPESNHIIRNDQMERIFNINSFSKLPNNKTMALQNKQKIQTISVMAVMSETSQKLDNLIGNMDDTFSQRLLHIIDERGIKDSEVYSKAHIDRRHFSKIRNDVNYMPNKRTVLAFAIALELSVEEADDLLRCAGFSFTRSSKTDIIIMYFLQNKIYDIFELNDVLDAYDQPVFW